MKKYILGVCLLGTGLALQAQTVASCCSRAATESFAMLSADEDFRRSHEDPLPFRYEGEQGKWVDIDVKDGAKARIYEIKNSDVATARTVLLFHEWWGINDYILRESDRIFNTLGNVNLVAVDLYDGQVASDKETAGKLMGELKTERATAIVNAVYGYIGKKQKVATIGWCMGGGWSLQAAILGGKQVDACVMYYGFPEKDVARLKTLHAKVMLVYPDMDKWITQQVVDEFKANMAGAKKSLQVETYHADHAFANPSNPHYEKEMAEDAYGKAMAFIKANW